MTRDFKAELQAARIAQDWDAHARVWEDMRIAEVTHDEKTVRPAPVLHGCNYVGAKLPDGTATLLYACFDGATGHMITGDGTLQHPLKVWDRRPMGELRAEFEAMGLRYGFKLDIGVGAYKSAATQSAWIGFQMARGRY